MPFEFLTGLLRRLKTATSRNLSIENPDLQRRNLSIAALAMAPLVGGIQDGKHAALAAVSTPMATPRALVTVPRDCFLITIVARTGTPVNKDDVVLQLDTEDEDRSIARIELAEQFIALQEAALSEDQINIRRQVLQDTADTADAYTKYANLMMKFNLNNSQVDSSTEQAHALQQAATTSIRANAELTRANSALDLFNFNTVQAKQKLTYVKEQLPRERADLLTRKARMTLKSPITGRITVRAYEGSFVSKGSVVAEII
jgi:hypothetical protein